MAAAAANPQGAPPLHIHVHLHAPHPGAAHAGSVVSHVHVTHEEVASSEFTPPHPPREETPAYRRAHHQLVVVEDRPCSVCGVRNSTLGNQGKNPFGAQALETHHYPVERSLADACDWRRVAAAFPQAGIRDEASFLAWIDSPGNLLVLCDVHHRSPQRGIHHLLPQDFAIQPYLKDGYVVAGEVADQAILARDEQIAEALDGGVAPGVPVPGAGGEN